jgi:hypothetical protein
MDMRAGFLQLLRDHRQSLPAVDQNVDRVSRSRRGVSGGPSAQRRVECAFPADPPQPTSMMGADLPAELVSEPTLGEEQPLHWYRSQLLEAGTSRRLDIGSAQILR